MRRVLALLAGPLLAVLLAASPARAARYVRTYEKSFPIRARGELHLKNRNGDVHVIAGIGPEIKVVAEKRVETDESAAVDEIADAARIAVDQSPDVLRIESLAPELRASPKIARLFGKGAARVTVVYQVEVPAEVSVWISTGTGSVEARGLTGEARLLAVTGNVEAVDLAQLRQALTTTGNLHLVLRGVAPLDAATENGNARIFVPADAAFEFDLRSVNGEARAHFPEGTAEPAGRGAARGKRLGGGPPVVVRVTNGNITLGTH